MTEKDYAEIIKGNEEYIEKFDEMFENLTVLKNRLDKTDLVTGRMSKTQIDLIKTQIKDKINEMNEFLELISKKEGVWKN